MGISVVPFPGIYVVKVFYVDFCLCPPGYIGEKTLFFSFLWNKEAMIA